MGRTFFAAIVMLCMGAVLVCAKPKDISEGNRLFNAEQYDKAIEKYNEALEDEPDSALINYDIGCAQYKRDGYDEAVESFNKGLLTEKDSLEAKSYYNIGNSKYHLGKRAQNVNPSEAAGLYEESLNYYRKAVEKDSTDKDAKYNYEVVKKVLEALGQQMEQQQQQQKGEESEEEKEQQQAQHQEGQEQEEQEQQVSEQQAGEEEEEKEGDREVPQPQEAEEMTEEEARMLLESFEQTEMLDKIKEEKKLKFPQVYRDW
jgi:tetratricopeptide (TPR) repeat protein